MARPTSDSPLLFEDPPAKPDFRIESRLAGRGYRAIAGLDEAGRGPLAGPVVAAAVILDPGNIPQGLDDSKRLSAGQREALHTVIMHSAVAISAVSLCAGSIDASDIRKASLEAMRRAAAGLAVLPDYALADGRDVPPGLMCPADALVKGDQRSASIAAASIVAKVIRDRMMARACPVHPAYGFSAHAGYATKRHRDAIAIHGGVARIHRFSFAPLRVSEETS